MGQQKVTNHFVEILVEKEVDISCIVGSIIVEQTLEHCATKLQFNKRSSNQMTHACYFVKIVSLNKVGV